MPKLREVLEERIRFTERELLRQKKLAERRKIPSMLDLHSKAEFGERVIKRFAWVEQAEEMDCGAACLAMICKHYGIAMTLGKLRELANVTTQGATLDSLARAGESLGFTTRGVQCTFESLRGFDLPFIVHWEGYHYIVVYGVSKECSLGGGPGARLQEDDRRRIRARLERYVPAVYGRPGNGADVRCALAVDPVRRLSQAVPARSCCIFSWRPS